MFTRNDLGRGLKAAFLLVVLVLLEFGLVPLVGGLLLILHFWTRG